MVDGRGVIRLGPRSAGADPGPACYDRGGQDATLTDANLVLGYLDAAFFLGGKMQLHVGRAEEAVESSIARRLALPLVRAAWGIHETANEDIARAFRVHAAERGFDYRGCSMIAFGGCGPLHALRIARKLRIPQVVFPSGAGVMSAFGLLVSPLSHEIMKSDRQLLDDVSASDIEAKFAKLTEEAMAFLAEGGVSREDATVIRRLDMRYLGQGYEIEVLLPAGLEGRELLRQLPALFAENYSRVFSMSFLEQPLEIVNWKVGISGPTPSVGTSNFFLIGSSHGRHALKGRRAAYFPTQGGYVDCPVFDRYALAPGVTLSGPALVEENESTCVIGVGDRVTVDRHGNLVATVGED